MTDPRGKFTSKQVDMLLQAVQTHRVTDDGQGHAALPQQDILAHLTRVFGFGGFDIEVLNAELVFEAPTTIIGKGRSEPNPNRWDATYRALVRLTVRNPDGVVVAHYDGGSCATAENQKRGEAHDLAYKSALSLSVKRAAIALGDQFGLSLYNRGQLSQLVVFTLVPGSGAPTTTPTANQEIPASLGETDPDTPTTAPEPAAGSVAPPSPQPAPQPPVAPQEPPEGYEARAIAEGRTVAERGEHAGHAVTDHIRKSLAEAQHEAAASDTPEVPPITANQVTQLHTLFAELGVTDRQMKIEFCTERTNPPRLIQSSKDLTFAEARNIIRELSKMANKKHSPQGG